MQSLLRLAFPPQCVSCETLVEREFALCGVCWRETPFVTGLICDVCGVPLQGEDNRIIECCDDCMTLVRPWSRGRAALMYRDNARRMVLALKHGDRLDLVRPAAEWMIRAGCDLVHDDTVIAPIPAHRMRLLKRRYNQAALLAKQISRIKRKALIPDLLIRPFRTKVQDGMSRKERFENLNQAIQPSKSATERLNGRHVLLIDDVMTSGATLAAGTEACHAAGARQVDVLVLARVAKDV